MRWSLAREFGGDELSPLDIHLRYEAIASASLATALILSQRDSAAGAIEGADSDSLRRELLPRPGGQRSLFHRRHRAAHHQSPGRATRAERRTNRERLSPRRPHPLGDRSRSLRFHRRRSGDRRAQAVADSFCPAHRFAGRDRRPADPNGGPLRKSNDINSLHECTAGQSLDPRRTQRACPCREKERLADRAELPRDRAVPISDRLNRSPRFRPRAPDSAAPRRSTGFTAGPRTGILQRRFARSPGRPATARGLQRSCGPNHPLRRRPLQRHRTPRHAPRPAPRA